MADEILQISRQEFEKALINMLIESAQKSFAEAQLAASVDYIRAILAKYPNHLQAKHMLAFYLSERLNREAGTLSQSERQAIRSELATLSGPESGKELGELSSATAPLGPDAWKDEGTVANVDEPISISAGGTAVFSNRGPERLLIRNLDELQEAEIDELFNYLLHEGASTGAFALTDLESLDSVELKRQLIKFIRRRLNT